MLKKVAKKDEIKKNVVKKDTPTKEVVKKDVVKEIVKKEAAKKVVKADTLPKKEVKKESSSKKESKKENGKADTLEEMDVKMGMENEPLLKIKTSSKKSKMVDADALKPGYVYLGRIPHGFYEKEMKAYFSQFGNILRLRLARSKKTGNSKHFAFIEFESEDVAKIVADTMNGYLLFGHILQCKQVPFEKLHPRTFEGAEKRFKAIPRGKIERLKYNKLKSLEVNETALKRLVTQEKIKRRFLEEKGIKFDFPTVVKPKK
ncbi:hypothetical protein HDU97_005509 [Phlyctochytrium planicorne]|nr:hypothetical protein HDU97_005509 [Phlyctochytrium planicorne]